MLKPGDIEQKTFPTSLRGYDLDEVDNFLDDVVSTIRDLEEQLDAAKSAGSGSTPSVGDETAVGRALVAAQTAADQMISDAREKADKILEEAKAEADSWAEDRDQKKTEAEAEMAELSSQVADVRTKLAVLATTVADRLDEMDGTLGSVATVRDDAVEEPTTEWDSSDGAEEETRDDTDLDPEDQAQVDADDSDDLEDTLEDADLLVD